MLLYHDLTGCTLRLTGEAAGIRLEPKHIHRTLRKLAGAEDSDAARRLYPLVGADDLAVLG